jgi:hypothetical protein
LIERAARVVAEKRRRAGTPGIIREVGDLPGIPGGIAAPGEEGRRPGRSAGRGLCRGRQRIRQLEKQVAEPRRVNRILKTAACFVAELNPRMPR